MEEEEGPGILGEAQCAQLIHEIVVCQPEAAAP